MISKSTIVVRYAETDKMGIVHHSVYPIWYELARTELVKNAGFSYSKMEQIGVMTPLVSLNCKFIKPAQYEDELSVTARLSKLTPVKIEFYYEVFKSGESKPINTGSTLHALVDNNFKIVNIKKEFPEIYDFMEGILERGEH